MARCRFSIHEADGELPMVCMRCGAPATVTRSKRMSWYPPWVIITIIAGVLPFAIIATILTKRTTVQAPLCDRHKRHWSKRVLTHVLCLLLVSAGTIGAIAFLSNGPPQMQNRIGGLVCGGCVVLLLGWLVLAVILQFTAIRPAEITDTDVTLVGLSPAFIEAVEEAEAQRRANLRDMRSRRDEDEYVPRPVRPADAIQEESPRKGPRSDQIEE